MLANKWTTITGILIGLAEYVGQNGITAPQTSQAWVQFWIGAGIAVLGVCAKDATTGSTPTKAA